MIEKVLALEDTNKNLQSQQIDHLDFEHSSKLTHLEGVRGITKTGRYKLSSQFALRYRLDLAHAEDF